MQRYNYMTNQFEIRRKWASSLMHVFVRQYMRLQFNRQSDESYQENKTRISSAVMRTNVAIERHASKVYTRKMFEQFGENLFEGGSYRVEEIEKTKEKYRRTT